MIADRLPEEPEDKNYVWQALFDYDKMGPFLTLRNRRPGDWFCPAGMGGKRKKLQDYFVDEKVPRRKRDTVPLLCSGEDILWVVGLRTDDRFLPDRAHEKGLIVRVRIYKTANNLLLGLELRLNLTIHYGLTQRYTDHRY